MSGRYLEDSRPENGVSERDIIREDDGSTYQSLLPSSSRSQLIPGSASASASVVTGTTERYLHAHDSYHLHHSRERLRRPFQNRQVHRRSHGKKFSLTDCKRGSEDFKHLYLKIKIGFLVICIINVLVVVFCIMTSSMFEIFPDSRDDFLYMGDSQLKTFKLCAKCQPLTAKVGNADGLVQQIRSSKYPKFCCFRRVDQLLRLIDWYSKTYVKQEIHIIKESYPLKNDAINRTHQPVFVHLYFKDDREIPETKDKDANLTWETTGIGIQRSHIDVTDDNSVLVILQTGFYYVYSHLVFRRNGIEDKYRHMISLVGLKDNGMAQNTTTKSVLQGIYKLEKGSCLSVTASYNLLVWEGRLNYFGMYKL